MLVVGLGITGVGCRPRRRRARPVRAGRRRPRPRLRYVAVVEQARPRRPALPRQRPGRRRPRERGRARHPDGGHRPPPDPRAADAPARSTRPPAAGRPRCCAPGSAPATCSASPRAPPARPCLDRAGSPPPRPVTWRRSWARASAAGILSWDGQLEDDARLVTTVARTAAALGAEIRTRARAVELQARGAVLRDELTGTTYDVRARAVVNAAGVWAGDLVDDVELRPEPRAPTSSCGPRRSPACGSR